jgi:oligosaccharide repeat unit polymerase
MFLVYITGILLSNFLPLVIPLRYEIMQKELLIIILLSFISYLIGEKIKTIISSKKRHKGGIKFKEYYITRSRATVQMTLIITVFVLLFIYGASLFTERGIPLFRKGLEAAELKLNLSLNTAGRTRIIDLMLPFISLYLYSLYLIKFKDNPFPKIIVWIVIFSALTLLIFRLFKGNILYFLVGILHVRTLYSGKKIQILNFKNITIILLIVIVFLASIFYFTEGLHEGVDFLSSVLYLANRVLIYSWEGLNFIVSENLGPDFNQQFRNFLSLESSEDPGSILAQEFFGLPEIRFAVVPTLFGFLYRNGGYILIVSGFILLGFIVKPLSIKMDNQQNKCLENVFYYYLYVMLFKIFLVGNVFNEIRGMAMSILFIYFLLKVINIFSYELIETVKFARMRYNYQTNEDEEKNNLS